MHSDGPVDVHDSLPCDRVSISMAVWSVGEAELMLVIGLRRSRRDEPRHQLDMRRVAELIDRRHALEPVAAIDQDPRVARECRGIARHRDHDRHLARRELLRLRLRALPRRIEHHGVEVAQFLRHQRAAEQVARLGLDRLQPGRRVAAFCSAATAPASLSKAATRALAASRSANGPTPQNRSAMCLARLQCSTTSAASASSPAAVACRNEPGGSVTCAVPMLDHRRRAHQHQFAVTGQPRQPMLLGDARQRRDHRWRQRPGAAHVDVEAVVGRGHLDIERLARGFSASASAHAASSAPCRPGSRIGQRSIGDDGVAARGGKADAQLAVVAAARMQR